MLSWHCFGVYIFQLTTYVLYIYVHALYAKHIIYYLDDVFTLNSIFPAPEGYRIHLDFREWFEIEGSDKCEFDFLEVRDGPFGYSPVINKLCGKGFPSKVITSTTRFMWLQFKSDKNLGLRGFKATYSFNAIGKR